jgi:hypothetical protein
MDNLHDKAVTAAPVVKAVAAAVVAAAVNIVK